MALLLIHLLLPKLCKNKQTRKSSTNLTYLKKRRSQQMHAIRIIFNENKFAHTRVHFKENNILNIYQLNIFN